MWCRLLFLHRSLSITFPPFSRRSPTSHLLWDVLASPISLSVNYVLVPFPMLNHVLFFSPLFLFFFLLSSLPLSTYLNTYLFSLSHVQCFSNSLILVFPLITTFFSLILFLSSFSSHIVQTLLYSSPETKENPSLVDYKQLELEKTRLPENSMSFFSVEQLLTWDKLSLISNT